MTKLEQVAQSLYEEMEDTAITVEALPQWSAMDEYERSQWIAAARAAIIALKPTNDSPYRKIINAYLDKVLEGKI